MVSWANYRHRLAPCCRSSRPRECQPRRSRKSIARRVAARHREPRARRASRRSGGLLCCRDLGAESLQILTFRVSGMHARPVDVPPPPPTRISPPPTLLITLNYTLLPRIRPLHSSLTDTLLLLLLLPPLCLLIVPHPYTPTLTCTLLLLSLIHI